ncbi:MAG: rane fusion protein heavy metal efflux system [Sphingomonadales bacterium]|jgi:cobalt-zinc-cadmium efflux system membrane fusion protein|nr:rane fusion protein heavy metal efflux system [Sphingomonadales bacterium]
MTDLIAAGLAAGRRVILPALLALVLTACGGGGGASNEVAGMDGLGMGGEKAGGPGGVVPMTPQQIAAAGIELTRPIIGGSGGSIQAAALIESDPDATRVVAVPIEGRIIALTRNLGDYVRRGDTLAIIESREAASLQAEVERARSRLLLARATLNRDRALYQRGFRPLRELEISQAAFEQAQTDLRMAGQQVAASGLGGGSLNRIVITAPIAGRVIARRAVLGQVFMSDAPETELFRIADTNRLSVTFSLTAADAARVARGSIVQISTPGRQSAARISFVSPAVDPNTRLVPVIARLDNPGGQWRVGEPVSVAVEASGGGGSILRVPTTAVQMVQGRSVVFVRTGTGFRAVPVTLGGQDGGTTIVTAGLTGGEQIAATNSYTLKAQLERGGGMDMD